MIKLGIRGGNMPVDEEKEVLLHHIVDKYGNHTHEEFILAFDLAMTGNLDIEDANSYENFSCAYVSKIMTSYRVWAAKTYKAVVPAEKKEADKEDLNDSTMQEMWDLNKHRMFTEGMSVMFAYPSLYEWREKKGDFVNSGIKKSEYIQRAVDYLISDLTEKYNTDPKPEIKKQIEDFNRMKSFSIVEAYYTGVVTLMAKRLIVYDLMKKEVNETNQE